MGKIKIGRVTGAQGLRGEVRIYHDSADEEALRRLTSFFLRTGDIEGGFDAYRIEGMRMHKRTPILKLAGVNDRSAAEALTGMDVYCDAGESRPKEEGAWLVSDLVGLEVVVDCGGPTPGGGGGAPWRVINIIGNPAHDILEIETEKGVFMLPFIDIFVRDINIKEGKIVITPPEGWQD